MRNPYTLIGGRLLTDAEIAQRRATRLRLRFTGAAVLLATALALIAHVMIP